MFKFLVETRIVVEWRKFYQQTENVAQFRGEWCVCVCVCVCVLDQLCTQGHLV